MTNKRQCKKSQKNKLCFGKRIMSGIVSLSLAVSLMAGVPFVRKVNAAEQVKLHNPVVDMDSMCAGQKVTWDCVWFGTYPQTEVKSGDSEYAALQDAEGWDDNGDVVVDGTKYRRMRKDDATYATSRGSGYYRWEDDTTYHYFRYEPVKWRVLNTDGSRAMLLSDIVLDDRKYNTQKKGITWETSTIRSWLNGYSADANQKGISYIGSNFIDSAFTAEEKAAIANTDVINSDNKGGNNTVDKLFLLSGAEAYTDNAVTHGFVSDEVIYDEARRCKGSDYAKAMGLYSSPNADGSCWWWLRSPGSKSYYAVYVNVFGNANSRGSYVNEYDFGVRVALNLNLTPSNLYAYAGTVCSDGTVNEGISREGIISNPKIVKVTDAQYGQNVKYDCVYFGKYPQTEVKNTDSVYAALQAAGGWDGNGDAVINGTKYRRLCKNDTKSLGSYYWEDNTTYHYFKYEPVKWRVLKTDGNKAMLLSDMAIDDREYNTEYKNVTWEASTIRSWLNGYSADANQEGIDYSSSNFMGSAFTEEEKAAIADTNVINNDNQAYGTEGGNDTNDKLFLLSESEVCTKEAKAFGFSQYQYVYDISRKCWSSDYANAMGALKGKCFWWLRSPGCYSNYAACVNNSGYVFSDGDDDYINHGVRVALNLNLSPSNIFSYAGTVCSDEIEESPAKKQQSIKATKSYKKAYGAKPFKLNAKLTKGNGRLSYTTSDKKIATVDKNGKVTIKGTGICTITVKASATDTYKSASAKITITIKPKKNLVTKVKASVGRILNITWRKDVKGTGYELQYSTVKSFSGKYTVTLDIPKNKTTSYKIRKLAKGKRYYVRIRTYRSIKENGKTGKLYGDWSTAKRSGKVR